MRDKTNNALRTAIKGVIAAIALYASYSMGLKSSGTAQREPTMPPVSDNGPEAETPGRLKEIQKNAATPWIEKRVGGEVIVAVPIGPKCQAAIDSMDRDDIVDSGAPMFNPQDAIRRLHGCKTEKAAQDRASDARQRSNKNARMIPPLPNSGDTSI